MLGAFYSDIDPLAIAVLVLGVLMLATLVVALGCAAAKGDRYAARALREDREVSDLDRLWDLS